LRAAIRDDDPVLFLEHRGLYFRRDDIADLDTIASLGAARIVSAGHDLTIITYSKMVWEAMAAVAVLAQRGISAEVIDLRSLSPLDMDTVIASVQRTSRALVVHEAVLNGGLGAEIAARIQEYAFDWLDAPVQRLGAPFAPVPASPVLEDAFVPNAGRIVASVERMFGLQPGATWRRHSMAGPADSSM
jgi:acetoin:2,6-dichlorophenolindophenol oxidoreductase subunit beta